MTDQRISMLNSPLAREIQAETSRFLRQGRRMRKLSLAQAASEIQISPFLLKALEEGNAYQAVNIVFKILSHYGFTHLDFVDFSQKLLHAKSRRETTAKQREHLSIPGENPKPWTALPNNLSAVLRGSEQAPSVSIPLLNRTAPDHFPAQ